MSIRINGFTDTDHVEGDNYRTVFDWTIPPAEDTEAFVRAAAKSFADELRHTIQAHSE